MIMIISKPTLGAKGIIEILKTCIHSGLPSLKKIYTWLWENYDSCRIKCMSLECPYLKRSPEISEI